MNFEGLNNAIIIETINKKASINDKLILKPLLIFETDNLKRRKIFIAIATSTANQLNNSYFEINKPIKVFTKINSEPK